MGTDRKQHTEQSAAEISKKLGEIFAIDYKNLYAVWKEYNTYAIDLNSKTIAMDLLETRGMEKYLICFALETINMEMIKEITDGKKTIN